MAVDVRHLDPGARRLRGIDLGWLVAQAGMLKSWAVGASLAAGLIARTVTVTVVLLSLRTLFWVGRSLFQMNAHVRRDSI